MKKIIVGVDFSANSKKTIRFAIQLASKIDAEVTFVHVLIALAPSVDIIVNHSYYAHFQKEDAEHKRSKLDKLVKTIYDNRLPKNVKYSCVCELGDEISSRLIDCANRQNADFICTGATGNGLLTKLFGSVASHLITASPVPVFVVPENYRTKAITTICYASDMTHLETEIEKVTQLSAALAAKVNVLHFEYEALLKQNKKTLIGLAAKYEAGGVTFHYRKMDTDAPLIEHLQKSIAKLKPSLLVLFTKQDRSWFDRMFLSSKSAEFSFSAKVPLLVYRKRSH